MNRATITGAALLSLLALSICVSSGGCGGALPAGAPQAFSGDIQVGGNDGAVAESASGFTTWWGRWTVKKVGGNYTDRELNPAVNADIDLMSMFPSGFAPGDATPYVLRAGNDATSWKSVTGYGTTFKWERGFIWWLGNEGSQPMYDVWAKVTVAQCEEGNALAPGGVATPEWVRNQYFRLADRIDQVAAPSRPGPNRSLVEPAYGERYLGFVVGDTTKLKLYYDPLQGPVQNGALGADLDPTVNALHFTLHIAWWDQDVPDGQLPPS